MPTPAFNFLTPPHWQDYELLDSGAGARLERFGPYTFVRPEHQAVWQRALPAARWEQAHAIFQTTNEESGGHWQLRQPIPSTWTMRYQGLAFQAAISHSRHLGVFPEQANHWDWMGQKLRQAQRPLRVLNLFGYTGLATLAAAQAGAVVTHVDASKKAVAWARQNQVLSNLLDRPIRWLVEDAEKFVKREVRRGAQYDGIIKA